MNFAQLFLRAALLAACAAAASAAPTDAKAPPAADPVQPVPPTRYQGALPYRPAASPARTPDRNWKAANRTVGAYNSMSLTMRGMTEPMPAAGEQAGEGTGTAPESQHAHQHHGGGQ